MTFIQKNFKYAMLLWALLINFATFAQGPGDTGKYYSTATGTTGEALQKALGKIISQHDVLSYNYLWDCYKTTDLRADGKIWDMYSSTTNYVQGKDQAGSYKKEGDCYNREHSFPKSWFSKSSPMVTDLIHIVPTDGYVNNKRSSHPFGETDGDMYKSNGGFSKLGKSKTPGYSGTVFEPADEYKGDFARIYFYMATCYYDRISSWSSPMLAGNSYPAYTKWAIDLLLRWAKEDPVSEKEIKRNAAVFKLQKNRNPYVDYPGLEQYVWGDKIGTKFQYDNYDAALPADPTPIDPVNPDTTKTDPETPDTIQTDTADINTDVTQATFVRVSSDDQLVIGREYLIVCESKGMAMTGYNAPKDIFNYTKVTVSGGSITTKVGDDNPHTLKLGGEKGSYTLFDTYEGDYLCCFGEGNKLSAQTSFTDNSGRWDITIGNSLTTIKSCQFSSRTIQYNSSSPRFATYTNRQAPISLFMRTSTTAISSPSVYSVTTPSGWYTISGVKLSAEPTQHGIYLHDGKKVIK